MAGVGEGAVGSVAERQGAAHARLFVDGRGGWSQVTPETHHRRRAAPGTEARLEGKDIIRDTADWDGTVTLRLSVTEDGRTCSDRVALRAALLTHTHLQVTRQILTAPGHDPEGRRFIRISTPERRRPRAGVDLGELGDQGSRTGSS